MFIIALIFALIIAFEIYKMTIQQKSNKDKWIIVVISLIFCICWRFNIFISINIHYQLYYK